jgi:heptose-I-phosphate ethanolaminephosphotransferase
MSIGLILSFFIVLPQWIMSPDLSQFGLLVILFIFLVLLSKLQRHLFAFFVILVGIFDIIEANIAFHWGGYGGALSSRIAVSLQSPAYETIEYLKNYINFYDIALVLYVVAIWAYMFYHLKKLDSAKKYLFTIALLSFVLLAILQNQEPLKSIKEFFRSTQRGKIIKARKYYLNQIKTTVPQKQKGLYDKIIIIQGEAANKHYMQVYGYPEKTTPFLSSQKGTKGFYCLNAIAPSNQTRYSIPMFYTDAHVNNWEDSFIHSTSIFKDFSHYGYTSYWLSNQGKIGKWNDFITCVANEAEHAYFFNQNDYIEPKKDIAIVSYLKTHTFATKKALFLLHLLGSHVDYAKRYENTHVLHKNASSILEQYDNTIFYTDYVLEKIFSYFKSLHEKILIVYLSDHGEVVSQNDHGHGHLPPFKDEYDVPFILYSSIPNHRIDALSNMSQKHYINLENLNQIIPYISGISDTFEPSVSSHVFSVAPEHPFDYDTLPFFKTSTK